MTVGNKSDESKHQSSGPFYICLQNVPSSAGQKDVREFFNGLDIASGGITFHGRGAYIVFYSREDALAALHMARRRLFLGMVMRVSNVEWKEMRRSQIKNVTRKLAMDCSMLQTTITPAHVDQLKRRPSKRIRPTTVSDKVGSRVAQQFCPDEIEAEDAEARQPVSHQVTSTVAASSVGKKQHLKTIKPTPVVALKQYNLFYEQEVF